MAQYSDEVDKFRAWARDHCMPAHPPCSVGGALYEHLEDLHFQASMGCNRDRGELVAARGDLLPPTRKHGSWHPARALQALKGFRRLAPGLSRAPLPHNGLMCIIGVAVWKKEDLEFGLAVLIGFQGYLRPSELVGLLGRQLMEPVEWLR